MRRRKRDHVRMCDTRERETERMLEAVFRWRGEGGGGAAHGQPLEGGEKRCKKNVGAEETGGKNRAVSTEVGAGVCRERGDGVRREPAEEGERKKDSGRGVRERKNRGTTVKEKREKNRERMKDGEITRGTARVRERETDEDRESGKKRAGEREGWEEKEKG